MLPLCHSATSTEGSVKGDQAVVDEAKFGLGNASNQKLVANPEAEAAADSAERLQSSVGATRLLL
jgi:hypothetical protein